MVWTMTRAALVLLNYERRRKERPRAVETGEVNLLLIRKDLSKYGHEVRRKVFCRGLWLAYNSGALVRRRGGCGGPATPPNRKEESVHAPGGVSLA